VWTRGVSVGRPVARGRADMDVDPGWSLGAWTLPPGLWSAELVLG
jgi:hypothetical protein